MTAELQDLAEAKAEQSGESKDIWFKTLESARTSLKNDMLSDEALEAIARASKSPEKLMVLMRLIYQFTKKHPNDAPIVEQIFRRVNNTQYSLSDWIDAIAYFHSWLTERKLKIDLQPMIRYLTCCTEAPDAAKSGHALVALAEDMLATYDYEAGY